MLPTVVWGQTNKAGTTRMQNHPSNNSAQNFQVPVPVPVFENLRLIPSPPLPSHMFFEWVAIVGVSFYLGQQAYGARLRRRVATSGSRSCCSAKTDYAAFVSTTGDAFCFSQYTFQECDFDSPHTPPFPLILDLLHTHTHTHTFHFLSAEKEMNCSAAIKTAIAVAFPLSTPH